jgi:hypothetical protein
VDRIDAAVHQHDARRRRLRQHLGDVARADVLRIEREDAVLERVVDRARLQHRVLALARRDDADLDRLDGAAGQCGRQGDGGEDAETARVHASSSRLAT